MAENDDFGQVQARLRADQFGLTQQSYKGYPRYFLGDLFFATCLAPFRKRKPRNGQRDWRTQVVHYVNRLHTAAPLPPMRRQ